MYDLSKKYSSVYTRYSVLSRAPSARWVIMLPGAGCEYYKRSGGCTMCGFSQSTYRYSRGFLLPGIAFKALFKIAEKAVLRLSPTELSVFNGGSFFNDNEVPISFQDYVYRKVAKSKTLDSLFVETRCEYISAAKIEKALSILGDKRLVVGIGLESQDDRVRNGLIRKGLSKRDFESKVRMLRGLGASISAYVFLKPLGLSEEEAYKEALLTIRYALSVGVSEIDLSCAFVQENTAMSEAFHKGCFSPPSLWTILEIIREIVSNDWPVSIGGFIDEPEPIAIPGSCPDCSAAIYEAIESFRQTRVLGIIPECRCRPPSIRL